jgi:uncharacterized membrane protein YkvA (DUF1232 family)
MQKNIIRLGLLTRLFQDLKLLFPLIKDYWKGTYRDVSGKSIVIFIGALAYIISPIDLIPDYIIGFGQNVLTPSRLAIVINSSFAIIRST